MENSALAAQSLTSWTDDLPVCRASGIGAATNEIYRRDGRRADMHPLEDRSFHFSVDEFGICAYGVFDGFGGFQVADFASKKFPAEILLGQLSGSISDEGIRSILRLAFESIDGEYFSTIDEYLASRMVMRLDQRVRPDDPNLAKLEAKSACGASCVVAILLNETKLLVASVGDTRAVVCSLRTNPNRPEGTLKALPLTIDHVIGSNEDEALRLSHLGLDIGSAIAALGHPGYTRCLGHHRVKGGYKEIDLLSKATDEPVLAEPEIHGGFQIQMHHLFLLIYSKPLADCMEAIMGGKKEKHTSTEVSTELCRITLEQFDENTTVSGVAQSVVDKVVRMHREVFETSPGGQDTLPRDDLTLLVRNFHANLSSRRLSGHYPGSNDPNCQDNQESNTITSTDLGQGSSMVGGVANRTSLGVVGGGGGGGGGGGVVLRRKETLSTNTSRTTESSDVFVKPSSEGGAELDENGKIKAYVDFSHFHREWNKANSQQQSSTPSQLSSLSTSSHNGL